MHPDPTRRLILAGGVLALPGLARAACKTPVVLFVCPAGTVKSPIARELLRRRAAGQGLILDVRSRAIAPEDHLSPELARRLAADGISRGAEPPRAVTPADVARADVVIAFDGAADAPAMRGARAWRTPSWNSDYERAKSDLDSRLAVLVEELAAGCGREAADPASPGARRPARR